MITIITHFLQNTPISTKHFLYLYGLYSTKTQPDILIIILLQPELENDISTPAPVRQKPLELWQVSCSPMHTAQP